MASKKDDVYTYNGTHSVVKDFNEYSGIPLDIIELNIRNHRELIRDEWNHLKSNYKERDFYAQSKYYIYDLLIVNYNWAVILQKLHDTNPEVFPTILNTPGKRFLEFGGGLGVFCEMVAHKGKDVTYLDIPGPVYDFAKWRFNKYNSPVKLICSDVERPNIQGEFDIIYSDAVLEHVKNPLEIIKTLAKHTAKNGVMILHIDLHGHTKEMPLHKDVNIKELHNQLVKLGFINMVGTNRSFSMWNKLR